MAIHFISGKPGGGKTMYALKLIVEELLNTRRLLVTNVPLLLPRLNEYLQLKYPDANVDLHSRVRMLDEDECAEFWLYRLPNTPKRPEGAKKIEGQKAPPLTEAEKVWDAQHRKASTEVAGVGAFIVLDELHLFFNSRKWMDTGVDCLHYLSQHRKLGDDVICVTQSVENVDKQFRSVAQDFTVIKNGYTQKIGWFRSLPSFTRRTYTQQPTGGGRQEAFETAHFRLDAAGLASCYDTAAGIGVHGRNADKNKKPKGLHPAWFPVFLVVPCVLFWLALRFAMNRQMGKLHELSEKAVPVDTPKNDAQPAAEGDRPANPLQTNAENSRSPGERTWREPERPRVRGYVVRGDKINVLLSDGRTLTERDTDGVSAVTRNGAVVNGEMLYMVQPAAAPVGQISTPTHEVAPVEAPAAASADGGSWRTDGDGVQRLREPEQLAVSSFKIR